MITIRTRCAIVLVILNTMLFVFAIVCFSMHGMDRASPAWKGGSGLPKMHQQFLPQRSHRTRNRFLTNEDVSCTYNNTMTLFVLSDGVNRERRNSLRRIYRNRRSVRNFCMKYFFVIYGEVQKSEKSSTDYLVISSYVQGYVEPRKIHFAYKSKPKVDLKLKSALGALQDPTTSESSSEETTEDESEETVEETIEEDDTKKKNRTAPAETLDAALDALSKGRDIGKRHSRRRNPAVPATLPPKNSPQNVKDLMLALSTPNDVTDVRIQFKHEDAVVQTDKPNTKPCPLKQATSSSSLTGINVSRLRRSDRESFGSDEVTPTPQAATGLFEGLATGVKNLFGMRAAEVVTTTPSPIYDEEEEIEMMNDFGKDEKPPVTLFATRCDGRNCVPIEPPPPPCNCSENATERLTPEAPSRMNSLISISKIRDNRRLEEASSNSRWKVFVQDQQPVELHSLVAYLNHEAKILAKLEPCCSSLDGCPGCNHMFRQKLLLSTKLAPAISTKDTFALEDDVRKVLWNDPNDVILEFHVEPRGRKVTRYWKVFNM